MRVPSEDLACATHVLTLLWLLDRGLSIDDGQQGDGLTGCFLFLWEDGLLGFLLLLVFVLWDGFT